MAKVYKTKQNKTKNHTTQQLMSVTAKMKTNSGNRLLFNFYIMEDMAQLL